MSNPHSAAAAVAATAPIAAAPALCPPAAFAEVRARDHVMRYRRSGAGRAVLVLCAGGTTAAGEGESLPLWPELPGALAAHFRIIVPEVPAGATAAGDVAALLVDFLDGLGTCGVAVVATDRFCVAALELALLDADRIARVVLVPGGGGNSGGAGEATALDGALATTARAARPVPLLVVRRATPAAEALPLVTRFLEADEQQPQQSPPRRREAV
jgi:pimeloyl-ACP methyl ester carboxylesterase